MEKLYLKVIKDYIKALDHFFSDSDKNPKKIKAIEFARDLIQGTLQHQQEIDKIIQQHSKNWKLNRIAKVELTILRLAIFEMIYRQDVPIKVAIDEGIELSKNFGDAKSKIFVNGVLDAVGKSLQNKLKTPGEIDNG
jgi:N utilization substance protein B